MTQKMSARAPSSEALPRLWLGVVFSPALPGAEVLRLPALRSARALLRKPNTGTAGIVVSTCAVIMSESLVQCSKGQGKMG